MYTEDLKRALRSFFLCKWSDDDFYTMVDSSAFNDIIKAFVKKAVEVLPQNEQEKVIDNLRWLFDEKTAKEIVEEK